MLRPRFHTRQPFAVGERLNLEKEPSRHIARALRMRIGDVLCLFNGNGEEAHATIAAVDREAVAVTIHATESVDRESPLDITLAIALSRGDRMDTIVQKATELGVGAIHPVLSERTGVRLDAARLARKRDHWEKIAISACEQCGRNRLPSVAAPVSLAEVLTRSDSGERLRLVLHPKVDSTPLPSTCSTLTLLIGPEGGFSKREIDAAMAAGFGGLQLGPRVLRTETAPLAAIAIAQAHWGDLS